MYIDVLHPRMYAKLHYQPYTSVVGRGLIHCYEIFI